VNVLASIRDRTLRAWPLALLAGALLFYARSYTNYFVCDDYQFVGRINFDNAADYFTKSWGYGNEYRPVVAYSYALDNAVSGESPVGRHIVNTLLHAANSILIALLLIRLGVERNAAILAGAVYIVSPVGHEAVVWMAGRPVVLGAFFVLASCYCFLQACAAERRAWRWWIGAYLAFILALGTYEVAIVAPLLVTLTGRAAKIVFRKYWVHLATFFGIATAYALFWNWFFEFKITRFPVEESILGGLHSLWLAATHTFHGSLRPAVAPIYAGLLIVFWRARGSLKLTGLAAAWLTAAYLPFFIVRGYADRFAYLSSAAGAAVLALALAHLVKRSRAVGASTIIAVLCYFGAGMQHRITDWKEAGEIARNITQDIKRALPEFPDDKLVVLLNIPPMHRRAYVYLTGLDRALQREYPGQEIRFATSLGASADENSIVFEYADGRMKRRPVDP